MTRIEEQYNQIVKSIKLYQNGAVSGAMEEKGDSGYMLNFGVSLTTLREISKQYAKSNELALLLWNKNFRETKILATLLAQDGADVEQFIPAKFNIELVEQIAFNLMLIKSDLCCSILKFLKSDQETKQAIALQTFSLAVNRKKIVEIDSIDLMTEIFNNESVLGNHNFKSILNNLIFNLIYSSDEVKNHIEQKAKTLDTKYELLKGFIQNLVS